MIGPLLSVLLIGIVPVWGVNHVGLSASRDLDVAPPIASTIGTSLTQALQGRLSASGVLIVDLDSAQTLYEDDADQARPMASLTKLMTALLIVENGGLDDVVTIGQEVNRTPGTIAGLKPGDQFTVGDLLTALLVDSANDAAMSLAVHHSGSEDAFVKAMNTRALSLGLSDTSYVNASGLDAPGQWSSARDVSILTTFALRSPDIARRMSLREGSIRSRSGTALTFTHTHLLLGQSGIVAGKTGTTDEAGQCLLSVVQSGEKRFAVVLLHSNDRYGDMRRVLSVLPR